LPKISRKRNTKSPPFRTARRNNSNSAWLRHRIPCRSEQWGYEIFVGFMFTVVPFLPVLCQECFARSQPGLIQLYAILPGCQVRRVPGTS
jgi:hypothetical protein